MERRIKNLYSQHVEKFRFAIVGVANTALDFAILFFLTSLGIDKIVSNFASTGVAFIFSFFVNKSFTFKSKGGNAKKQFALFLAVSLIGMWVIQPLTILGVDALLAPLNWSGGMTLLAAKLVATVATLIWNYILYAKLVFKAA